MFLNNLKIRTKIFVAFLAVIAVSIGAIGVNFFLLNDLTQRYTHIITTVDPSENATFDLQNSFNIDMRAIEEYGNGYANLDETEQIVHAAEAKIESDIKIIEHSDLVEPKFILALRDVLKKDEMQDEKVFELKKDAKNNTTQQIVSPEVHQALVAFDQVNDEVNTIINEIVNESIQHKAVDVQEFENVTHQSRLYIGVSLACAIIISLLLALVISFALSRQIKLLSDTAVKMGQGDLMQKTPIVSKDELGGLAVVFNSMTDKIRERTTETEEAKKQLEAVNSEMQKKLEEIEKINKLMVGRELRMAELKKENETLKQASKQAQPV